jgi:hypothetical protein
LSDTFLCFEIHATIKTIAPAAAGVIQLTADCELLGFPQLAVVVPSVPSVISGRFRFPNP